MIIGAARLAENGDIIGGKAGDQTGHEVERYKWTDRPGDGWVILRAKDPAKREKLAKAMEAACDNENIGYGQDHNQTLYREAEKVDFDIEKVNVPCWTDCCRLERVTARSAGIKVDDCYTATQVKTWEKTGEFEVLTGEKYAHTDKYLLRGDVGCMPPGQQGHTWTALEDGALANITDAVMYEVTGNAIWIRSTPNADAENKLGTVKKGERITATTITNDGWVQCEYKGKWGYASLKYLKPVEVDKPVFMMATEATRVRQEPNLTAHTVAYVKKYELVKLTGESVKTLLRTWYKCEYNGKTGWISDRYLK